MKGSIAAIVLGCAIAFGRLAQAAGPDLDYMARLVLEADAAHAYVPDFARIDPALDDEALYAIQARYVRLRIAQGDSLAGFKGGFIPQAPIGGVLFASGMLKAPARLDASRYKALLVEAEIAFEFCAPVVTRLPDVAALKAAVCRLGPAVELPDAALHDLDALKRDPARLRRSLIPSAMGSRQLVLGAPRPAGSIDCAGLPVRTYRDDALIGERDLRTVSDLWANVLWIVNEFVIAHGYTIEPGQIITPGNLTGLHAGAVGHYRVVYEGLGTVEFDVLAGPGQ